MKLVVFSAPSGSGKSTIINYLLEKGINAEFSISATSRPVRGAEQNGVKMQYIYQYASETNKELFAEGENATIIISMCEVAGKKIAKLPAKKASIVDVFLKK